MGKKFTFDKAEKKAKGVINNPKKLNNLIQSALAKLANKKDREKFINEAKTMLMMLKAYAKGDYRQVPWRSITLITAALIYFVAPLDAIPDFVPVVGFMDDATILLAVYKSLHVDIANFKNWITKDSVEDLDIEEDHSS
ncbi:YkvA family protein [Aureibacter tunicatorum]|uniref:Uncharacterized membrane protein YkvA (DUF1232 family) n=1 Tax=Aureibacter tunicatorum TaxID=866807 RepID=A0AAE4BRJ1_9BACT|nr:YkvA family protein [Aureibacter tunicatorum]MDR6238721.1 uncharacterized membrane protein YkvA (DUF1232 family) [Aureibacter tunicatorum]BDD05348.1 hypothetical protein AUTU_28310 [Aureibacter tunicatorum]